MHSQPSFWAKTDDQSDEYHPLIAHSADVAAVMKALLRPGRALFDRLVTATGDPDPDGRALRSVLVYLAAIHDIGKANHGFQDKAGPLAHPGRTPWVATGHVRPLVETIGARLHAPTWLGLLEGLPWEGDVLEDMLFTTICHHGLPLEPRDNVARDRLAALWTPDSRTGRHPLRQIDYIASQARKWAEMPEGGWAEPPFSWTPTLANLFAGLLVTADWIGSSPAIFRFDRSAEADPHSYWEHVVTRAEKAIERIGLRPPARTLPETGLELYRSAFPTVFTGEAKPTPLQEILATAELPPPGSRIVIESDTGSGKTEAILALYARLRDVGRADGLVFALPTRATASAMRDRIQECLESLHPGGQAPTVALAMGGEAASRAEEASPLPEEGRIYDEGLFESLRTWASESAKRFFAAEVVVGTVDQVLLAGLPVKHAHHRLGLLSRHFIVVDELHSYDRYMGTVLRSVVDTVCAAGGTTAFLSATLSSDARHRLAGEEDPTDLTEARAAPYPAISVRNPSGWEQRPAEAPGTPRELRWHLGGWEEGLERAIDLARGGARVCILRNTVGDARKSAEDVSMRAPGLLWAPKGAETGTPVHSRYTPGDRSALDRGLLDSFGKGSTDSGVILVSTQVVEQSLDVDFDWMLTDLAPIDVLLQRAGRIHRHERPERPAAADVPAMMIHAPEEGFEARPRQKGRYGWGTVYDGIVDLELTRRAVERASVIRLPEMARSLIEGVYHREARERFVEAEPEWGPVEEDDMGGQIGQAISGRQATLDLKQSYASMAPRFKSAAEEKIRTRIGDDRVVVELDRPVAGWYAPDSETTELGLSARVLARAELPPNEEPLATWMRDTEDGPVYGLGKLELRYGRAGWSW